MDMLSLDLDLTEYIGKKMNVWSSNKRSTLEVAQLEHGQFTEADLIVLIFT